MAYQIQRGTYDAFGSDALNMDKIVEVLKYISYTYGYQPIKIPTYEQTELFTRSAGESSDIVNKEMFSFTDKGGRNISLRPELTAGTMRAIVTNKLYAGDLPLKLQYFGSAFRYERPQAGRYREFSQFGVECVGASSYLHDVETISLGYNSLKMLGFPHIILKINTLGDEESRNKYKAALKEYFASKLDTMCPDCKRRYESNALRILDCKVPSDREIIKDAPRMKDYLSDEAKAYFENVLNMLDEQQIEYELDDTLVRGLDYYSQVVFEYHFISKDGTNLGAIGAGGHYDKLLNEVGGPLLSSVGFAFGIERINALLKEIDIENYEKPSLDVFVIHLGEETRDYAFLLTQELRNSGFKADMTFENKGMGAQFKLATRKNAAFALIIGSEEMENNVFGVKNLATQEQVSVSIEELSEYLDKNLED